MLAKSPKYTVHFNKKIINFYNTILRNSQFKSTHLQYIQLVILSTINPKSIIIPNYKFHRERCILTVARFVVSILLPESVSPSSVLRSSQFAATSLRKLSNTYRVSRFGVGSSCIRCCSASCCNRLLRISTHNNQRRN